MWYIHEIYSNPCGYIGCIEKNGIVHQQCLFHRLNNDKVYGEGRARGVKYMAFCGVVTFCPTTHAHTQFRYEKRCKMWQKKGGIITFQLKPKLPSLAKMDRGHTATWTLTFSPNKKWQRYYEASNRFYITCIFNVCFHKRLLVISSKWASINQFNRVLFCLSPQIYKKKIKEKKNFTRLIFRHFDRLTMHSVEQR